MIIGDIGSSLMNADMALELLEEDIRNKTRILDTPIVEGSIAVAVQTFISNDINEILKAAVDARTTRKISN